MERARVGTGREHGTGLGPQVAIGQREATEVRWRVERWLRLDRHQVVAVEADDERGDCPRGHQHGASLLRGAQGCRERPRVALEGAGDNSLARLNGGRGHAGRDDRLDQRHRCQPPSELLGDEHEIFKLAAVAARALR